MTSPSRKTDQRPHGETVGGVLDKIASFLALAGTCWMCVVALLICAEVLSRGILNQPIQGLVEFVSLSVAPIMFLHLPSVILRRKLFRVEIFTGGFKAKDPLQSFFSLFHLAVLVAILLVLLPWVFREAARTWTSGAYSGVPGAYEIPNWPFYFTLVLGCGAMAVAVLFLISQDMLTLLAKRRQLGKVLKAARPIIFVATMIVFAISIMLLPDNPVTIGVVFIVWLFVMLALGFPIATVLLGLSAAGIFVIRDSLRITEVTMGIAAVKSVGKFEFAVVPLFVAMGMVLDRARIGEDAFDVAAYMLRRVRGGLAIATVMANAVFASVVGSSIASAAVFSRVAVGPMMAHGFSRRKAVGTVAGSSVLGMLIPPSLLLIVYGLISEQSIGRLFIAAIVPGLVLALAFAIVAYSLAPKYKADYSGEAGITSEPDMTALDIMVKLGPVAILVLAILGGIYSGLFTPTEAAGVGLVLAVIISVARGRMKLRLLASTFLEAGLISSALLFLIAAAGAYTRLLAFSQIPMRLNLWLIEIDPGFFLLMLIFVLVVLALGAVLDSISIILVMTPIILPLVQQLGADPIWFGILLVVTVEIGLLTPPFGMSAYTVREVLADQGVTLSDIFIGALPFVAAMLVVVALLIVVPGLATVFL